METMDKMEQTESAMEDSVSPPCIKGSIYGGRGESELSAEDVAWADSCLTKDPEISDINWNSFKDTPLKTINTKQENKEIFFQTAIDDLQGSSKTDISITALSKEVEEPKADNSVNSDIIDDFWSRHKMEEVFLPTYNENLKDIGLSDLETDLGFLPFEPDQSTEYNIFRVWDLDIPPEEDVLAVKLKKALSESSLEPTNPISDDSRAWKDIEDASLDDLISWIADLQI